MWVPLLSFIVDRKEIIIFVRLCSLILYEHGKLSSLSARLKTPVTPQRSTVHGPKVGFDIQRFISVPMNRMTSNLGKAR